MRTYILDLIGLINQLNYGIVEFMLGNLPYIFYYNFTYYER